MCGINGFNWSSRQKIKEMCILTKQRGPDNTGIFVDNSISLGHNRLSILDLSSKGNQPFYYDNKNLAIVYNGEIYNYKKIREELEKKGYKFRSGTDTEVILLGYHAYSTKILQKLEGMFAFCIYDKKKKSLFLARDKLGIKPFFYYFKDSKFVFSSDIKPILQTVGMDNLTLNQQEIYNYSLYKRTLSQSLFDQIKVCPIGSYLLFDLKKKTLKLKNHYDPISDISKIDKDSGDYSSYLAEFELLMEKSIRSHLVSDAKVGVVCSGGHR